MRRRTGKNKLFSRKDAFFGLHFDLHANPNDTALGAEVSEEMIEGLLRRVRPDFVQYDCKGHPGYAGYPTQVGTPAPGIVKDSLAVWRKVTKRHGVGLFIHYSGAWDSQAVQRHPEWARVDEKRKPDKDINSTFGPYVDELLIPQLKEAIDAYDLDGAWVDGECWAVKPDYCEAAARAWQEATGLKRLPRKPGDPHWREFLDFNREQFRNYVRRYVDALHAHSPGVQITSNWMYSSMTPDPVDVPLDYLSGDFSHSDSVNHARLEARHFASTAMPWDLMAWGFNQGEGQGWSLKTPAQLMQEAAVVLSQGGAFQVYYNPTRAGYLDGWVIDTMAKIARFCRARQRVSHQTETVPQAALLLSREGFYNRTNTLFGSWQNQYLPLHGVLNALLELHYSVDVLVEHQLSDRLQDYPAVVIPEWEVLEDGFVPLLLEYIRNGGNLLIIGAKTAALFGDCLGATCDGEPAETDAHLQAAGALAQAPGLWQKVTPKTARAIGWRFSTYDTRKRAEPAATVTTLGKGRICAIYGPLGEAHYRSHHPVIRHFLGHAMRNVLPDPLVRVEGPPSVDVALRRKGARLLIHLVNVAGMQVSSRHSAVDFIPPVGPLRLTVRLRSKPKSVSLVPEQKGTEVTWEKGELCLRLPFLATHSVVVLEEGPFDNPPAFPEAHRRHPRQ